MGKLTLNKIHGALVPIDQVRTALMKEMSVSNVADFAKAVEAAKMVDGKNQERRNYWGELALWSTRRLGELIVNGQNKGTINSQGGDRKSKLHDATLKISDLGMNRNTSANAKQVAAIEESVVSRYIEETKEGGEVSRSGLIKFLVS